MAELSGFWTTTGTATGDQQASYTQVHWSTACRIMSACSGFEGVAPDYLNELEGTVGGANTVAINTGTAMVDGKWFVNDASQNVNIPSAVGGGNTRIDRIVLRADWAGFNVSVYRIAGTDAASPTAPAITQTSGTTYDITLYQALVDTAGTVTLTDERTWANVDADRTANRTRTFLVQALSIDSAAWSQKGKVLPDAEDNTASGYFYTPSDFSSACTAQAVVYCTSASGDIYSLNSAWYSASGEAFDTHSASSGPAAVAITANQRSVIQSMSLSSLAAGDFVSLQFDRYGTNGSDTLNAAASIMGWLITYTADS